MTVDRALEIINSPQEITVLSDHVPVWLESVDIDKRTAQILIMGTDQKREAILSSLTDTGALM